MILPTPYYDKHGVTCYHADSLTLLPQLPDNSIDAVVTDPPYGFPGGFMGKAWDRFGPRVRRAFETTPRGQAHSTSAGPYLAAGIDDTRTGGHPYQTWCQTWATECLHLLKPGGHLLAFGGTRTWHRLACAIEDAGFEIRDSITWMYSQGFPKSLDVSKAIDAAAGVERDDLGPGQWAHVKAGGTWKWKGAVYGGGPAHGRGPRATVPATDAACRWQGWGTALKPAHEPVIVARKPLDGTITRNVLTHSTGALNVDACRYGPTVESWPATRPYGGRRGGAPSASPVTFTHDSRNVRRAQPTGDTPPGRWPSNVVLSHVPLLDDAGSIVGDACADNCAPGCPVTELDQQSGNSQDGIYGGSGGASRFFPNFRYQPKAPTVERPRDGNTLHVTVKPLDLVRWLVKLVTPPGGTILDPFAGSGTTGEAALREGFRAVLVEQEGDYLPLITARLNRRRDPETFLRQQNAAAGTLFDLTDTEGTIA